MAIGIYCITLVADGRCYVGQSVDIEGRWGSHRSALNSNRGDTPYLQNAWNKYGSEAFAFAVLEECDPERLTVREQHWMDTLEPVFNCAPAAGSPRGIPRSPETRAKLRAASLGKTHSLETRAKISALGKGLKRTPETRAKIAAAKIGNPSRTGLRHTPEARAKMRAVQAVTGPYGLAALNAAKTHCLRGHPLSGDNLKVNAKGGRVCRECARKATREYKRKRYGYGLRPTQGQLF